VQMTAMAQAATITKYQTYSTWTAMAQLSAVSALAPTGALLSLAASQLCDLALVQGLLALRAQLLRMHPQWPTAITQAVW
jgi:hypothetical protein